MEEQVDHSLMAVIASHFYFLRKGISLGLLLCVSQFLFSHSAQLKVSENSFFEIVGKDIQSTQFVSKLSYYVAESILNDLSEEDYSTSRKILVQLLNKEAFPEDSGYYKLSISDLGFVTLSISWDESLCLPILIESLVVSFIQSFGYATYGELFFEKYPSKAWILKGFSQQIYISLRPNVIRLLYEQAILEGFDTNLFNANFFHVSAPTHAQSFALYRLIISNQIPREDRLKILKYALVGKDVLPDICRSFRLDSIESLQEKFLVFLSIQSKKTVANFESLADSKKWLEAIGDFSSIEIESIESKHNSLHLLWINRDDPKVVQFIKARIQLISLALSQLNPLYYNAGQSLALTYQKILDGAEEWEILYYYSDFLAELDQSNTVSLEISKQLQSELP